MHLASFFENVVLQGNHALNVDHLVADYFQVEQLKNELPSMIKDATI